MSLLSQSPLTPSLPRFACKVLKSAFHEREEAIAASAVVASFQLEAAAIIVLTNSGVTARAVAKYRPSCPIIAVMSKNNVNSSLVLCRGPLRFRVFFALCYLKNMHSFN
jgi:pyruvate kinase